MKKLIPIIVLFTLFGCGAASDYSKKTLDNNFYRGKVICFKLNSKSQDWLVRKGPNQTIGGEFQEPDVKREFEKSIQELALETKLNLVFADTTNTDLNPNMVIIDVKVTKLLWKFGLSSATMYSDATYTISENQIFPISGSHKTGGAGKASNNVKKSFKNMIYNFLKEYEK
ncbi:hypothetical protein [Flavobacterium sp. 102]|uniref:hypothetical protein n=1 Tax=Flavobacterium sp. 102 TaxID=2135623 RepID=UPI000EAB93B9|nr:hypothetical protein [Flavobacterium sp. 102]RKS02848.1 hypothetical protein C8C84_2578 [Flavobacterium sp. 102]